MTSFVDGSLVARYQFAVILAMTNADPDYIGLADFLLIAEAVLDIEAERLARLPRMPYAESALNAGHAAFGDQESYSDPAERAAILCSRIVRNHPLPDGNKRVGYECMREALDRAGLTWPRPDQVDEIAGTIEDLAAGDLSEEDFVIWVHRRIASA